MALEALRPSPPSARLDTEQEPALPASGGLATLLDRFTASVLDPDAYTVGDFAGTVQSLHGELAMLARHFGVNGALSADGFDGEAFDFDDLDADAVTPFDVADYAGIAESEALEDLCRTLSGPCRSSDT
jgi:hypothetical protein